uniref:DEAD-box ATP-dependent RNA helicase 21-like n=1 Tax=Erigeron canadensis TaxID=72917 RepID=UPI001CB89B0D|nr:DEAD-box ATP-dependent RNA helicase 21-like [Erigeron canadensis]XP_043605892.1 DEAD-box ATP-dependent RNA helicase 21-like [Erigeron canadensis]XP_043605893.1 DEAD-box ATP-dependent RNA helicase 21-like [Erigeron canadensis]XP_043605894.1 DEAD-box ATP-dependent RNA helicase 21-like [Erigeron canadensis]XP_043605895.1 DEAD-box ATP-dependent RNA helicase 21-like [Erigeron canadensis]XP_043605896.1 DEAD-box ATP-dependent RNA helicase 21-like [Erigeron canadensis]XP_043605897.1 DEAD-box ATP-d
MNVLYQAKPLFGTGLWAGMDRIEQKKFSVKNEKQFTKKDRRVDRHWSEKILGDMKERDWTIFREDFDISYRGSKVPKPMRTWVESGLSYELRKAVDRVGYRTPSPIQMAAIPLGLQQRDVIGVAGTGSGKTAAFVLPMLAYISILPPISELNEVEGPYAVVLAPTRELALQIEEETVKLARYVGIKVVSIVGGQSIEEQGFKIRQGCQVVIATPGRLKDCLERRYVVLNQCNYVVLDEADRMMDMGFEPQVVGILDAMPSSNLKPENDYEDLDEKRIYRTTYMFSATMPAAVERLARKYLRNPIVVTIGTAGKVNDCITQHVIMVKESEEMPRLKRLLDRLVDKRAIVFVNTKKSADFVSKTLEKSGYHVTTSHGDKSQEQREISLEGFRTKRFNILVATEVAARGIDIHDVTHVINYDMPGTIDSYTHCIGRTGRAGKTGTATTFLTLDDSNVFYDLKQMLTESKCSVPPELARHDASKFKPGSIPDRPSRRNGTDSLRFLCK